MSTPDNVFQTIPSETLVTATGGVTHNGDLQPRDLRKLQHLITNTSQTQQANNNQGMTMALMACLAMRR